MKNWIVTFNDGSKVRIKAARYDVSLCAFMDETGNLVMQINSSSMKYLKVEEK